MNRVDKKDLISIFIVILIALIGEILFFYKQGSPLIDMGREFYVAQRVAEGGVLYKTVFNIYGPLAYQINALLFIIFGKHSHVLYFFGNFVGLCLGFSIYLLARQFLSRFSSLFVSLFTIFAGIYNSSIFNFVVPYSFAMLYGLLVVIVSLIFLVRYIKEDKLSYFYWSLILAGAAFVLKYEYFAYIVVYIYVIFCLKKISAKEIIKAILCFLSIPLFSFLPLILAGLNFQDFIFNIKLFKNMAAAPSLTYFYKLRGVYPSWTDILICCRNLTVFACVYIVFYKALSKISKSWIYWSFWGLITALLISLGFLFNFLQGFSFLPVLIVLMSIVAYKKIDKKTEIVLVIAALAVSLKTFFNSGIDFYSLFSIPLLILAWTVIAGYYFKNKKVFTHLLVSLLLVLFIPSMYAEIIKFSNYEIEYSTNKGVFKIGTSQPSVKLLIDLIMKNTKKTDKIVILPEGHFINFLADRKSDDMYNNLIPMYVEAFGEEKIINHFENNKPEYFVFGTRDMREYGQTDICVGYALNLCRWVFNNYQVVYKITGVPEYIVLRKVR